MHVSPGIRSLIAISIFVTLLPLLGLSEMRLNERRIKTLSLAQGNYRVPPTKYLRTMSFGFNELAADLFWVNCISYFADQLFLARDFRYLPGWLESIYTLDRHFKELYRYGPTMLMSRMHRLTNKDVATAIDLLKRGHKVYPDDWRLAFNIGLYYMFEMKSKDPAVAKRYKRMGADWIRRASILGSDIPWLPALVAQVYSEQGQRALAIRHLQELYLASQDEQMKQQIFLKLKSLKANQQADELQRMAKAWQEDYQASSINFIPADLFIVVQQKDLGPFSVRESLQQ